MGEITTDKVVKRIFTPGPLTNEATLLTFADLLRRQTRCTMRNLIPLRNYTAGAETPELGFLSCHAVRFFPNEQAPNASTHAPLSLAAHARAKSN